MASTIESLEIKIDNLAFRIEEIVEQNKDMGKLVRELLETKIENTEESVKELGLEIDILDKEVKTIANKIYWVMGMGAAIGFFLSIIIPWFLKII